MKKYIKPSIEAVEFRMHDSVLSASNPETPPQTEGGYDLDDNEGAFDLEGAEYRGNIWND